MVSPLAMAQLIVGNLEEEVKRRLQVRARRHGRSTEAEVREILRAAVASETPAAKRLGSRIASRFRTIGLDADLPILPAEEARAAKV